MADQSSKIKYIKSFKFICFIDKIERMKWLNYHHLYYFWLVAKEQSFTKAAHRLAVSQSSVSHQVAQLESFLGRRLLKRSTSKKLSLTEEGVLVFEQAEEIFRQGQELVDGFQNQGLTTTLRVGAIGSLSKNFQLQLLRPIIDNPQYQIQIDVSDSITLLKRLKAFQLDLILSDLPYSYSDGEPLIQREIAKENFCLVSKNSKLNKTGLYLPARSNPATPEIESYVHSNLNVKIKGYVDDIALLRLFALESDSIVAIPKIGAARELKTKQLTLNYEFKSLYQKFFLILRQKGSRTKKILSLLDQN